MVVSVIAIVPAPTREVASLVTSDRSPRLPEKEIAILTPGLAAHAVVAEAAKVTIADVTDDSSSNAVCTAAASAL